MYTEKDNRKVNVLGEEYSIMFVPYAGSDLERDGRYGYIDTSVREITVGIFEPDDTSVKDLSAYQKQVMRHEIIHAFFFESGLWNNSVTVQGWSMNEEMVDWLALQHEKLHAAFEKAGAL